MSERVGYYVYRRLALDGIPSPSRVHSGRSSQFDPGHPCLEGKDVCHPQAPGFAARSLVETTDPCYRNAVKVTYKLNQVKTCTLAVEARRLVVGG